MKVYIPNVRYDYPEDMDKIIEYLTGNGKLIISGKEVERYYREFSDEKYCAGWMAAHYNTIEEFADWLADIDI